jgi:hypothetical protein
MGHKAASMAWKRIQTPTQLLHNREADFITAVWLVATLQSASIQTIKRLHARAHTQKHAILFSFFSRQWFRERASVLHYKCTASLVNITKHVLKTGANRRP